MQNSLDGVSTSCTDISFKSREQWNHHKHPVFLLLSAMRHCVSNFTLPSLNIYRVKHSFHTRFSLISLDSPRGKQLQCFFLVNRICLKQRFFLFLREAALSRQGSGACVNKINEKNKGARSLKPDLCARRIRDTIASPIPL